MGGVKKQKIMYSPAFIKIINSPIWNSEFIGYGNPDADILIIGQEAAETEGSERWKKFYAPNCSQWQQTCLDNLKAREWDGLQEYLFPEYFNPSFPFMWQKATIKSGDGNSGNTWYWYQKLMDRIFPEYRDEFGRVNFFEKAFITELNGLCRPNQKVKISNIKENIAHRFDLMRASNKYWSHFKVVLFLCGPYADAINIKDHSSSEVKTLYAEIFGNATPFYYSQFSSRTNPSKFIREHALEIRELLCK